MMMLLAFLLSLAVESANPTTPESRKPEQSADELAGLWKARRRFGPDARGALVIERAGTAYTAEMVGRIVPVRLEGGELAFDLPNGEGRFRGKLEAGGILGHWFPPPSSALYTGGTFASPVRLTTDGPTRWRGEVVPFDDVFTFFLMAQKTPDGLLSVILRNPERDYGSQIGAEHLTRDGNIVKLRGKRQGQKEERDLASGTWDAANQVLTLTFPGRGGTYDFTRDGDESDFYPRGKNPGRYTYRPPLARDDGWPTGTLEEVGIDRAAMEKLIQRILDTPIDSPAALQAEGILVARHGKLVLEEYFHGENRDRLHATRSAAKTVTAAVVGAAMQAGIPIELSSPVYKVMNGGAFPPDLEPAKRAMTLDHLLNMSSGFFCDDTNPDAPGNEETMLNQSEEPDYYRYSLRVPLDRKPGEKAVYCSADPNLALGMVGRTTAESPMYTFDRLLGGPLKIHRYGWILDPAGHPYGGGSVHFLPRDFMKFGQLMLNGGTWKGRRILGADFVTRASKPWYHLRNIYYGYLRWGIDYPYKDRTVRGMFAGGAGGQEVLVIPELDLVIAAFAGNYSTRTGVVFQQNFVPRYLLPGVREAGDDPHAPVVDRDYTSPYGKSADGSPLP
jgi:CubicO group peptidase (beta-lactamase class C family)